MYERVYPLHSLAGLGSLIGLELIREPVRPVSLMEAQEAFDQAKAQVEEGPHRIQKISHLLYVLRFGEEYAEAYSRWSELDRIWPIDWRTKHQFPGTIKSWSRESSPKPSDYDVEYVVVGWDPRVAWKKETIVDVLNDVDHAIGCGCTGCANRMLGLAARHAAPRDES